MRDLLGGKGANVAEMTRVLGADKVPAGFTITTEACVAYMEAGKTEPEGLEEQVRTALDELEERAGKKLGDSGDPLLVSVRSGARESMPGMMDTVLNLGLNDETVQGLAATSGDDRFAWDSYRRFIQMYSDVVLELDHGRFEEALEVAKEDRGFDLDTQLEAQDWERLTGAYKELVEELWGRPFPQDAQAQLWGAIGAVF